MEHLFLGHYEASREHGDDVRDNAIAEVQQCPYQPVCNRRPKEEEYTMSLTLLLCVGTGAETILKVIVRYLVPSLRAQSQTEDPGMQGV